VAVPGEVTANQRRRHRRGGHPRRRGRRPDRVQLERAAGLERFATDTPDVDTIYVNAMTADGVFSFRRAEPPDRSGLLTGGALGLRAQQGGRPAQPAGDRGGERHHDSRHVLLLTNVQAVSADAP